MKNELTLDEAAAAEAMRDRIVVHLRAAAATHRRLGKGCPVVATNAATLEGAADHIAEMKPAPAPTGLEFRGG